MTSHYDIIRATYGRAAAVREPPIRAAVTPSCCHGSNLGCGDPIALAGLQAGETVVDLGSGPGFDCLLAAHYVGSRGFVIGIDLTAGMVDLARRNATEAGVANVSLVMAQIERLPLGDEICDAVISNCVINLCPDKVRALKEAHRVLRPGGRLAITDVVAVAPLPPAIAEDLSLYAGCISGAIGVEELRAACMAAGFDSVSIEVREESSSLINSWAPGRGLECFVVSAGVTASKRAR